ncbi:MAG TPA: O-antigen ligase family protein [Pyrinomonadaceae bacterium]|nr:O-antigen ligase family protein [Pyrinomonadaceae bacterium]
MPRQRQQNDYEPVKPTARRTFNATDDAVTDDTSPDAFASSSAFLSRASVVGDSDVVRPVRRNVVEDAGSASHDATGGGFSEGKNAEKTEKRSILKRGHMLSYVGLFLFTSVLYFRPYEFFPEYTFLFSLAFWVAVCTLAVFFPAQFMLEGSLTARPREVNLLLLFTLLVLVGIPLATDPGMAWKSFNDLYVKNMLMFIVIVNVVRTERRLKWLLLLALAVGCVLSVSAFQDFQRGNFTVEGYRVTGNIGGMFGNVNDMALHLVVTVPIAVGLFLQTRNILHKVAYALCCLAMLTGIFFSYSRGAFLGLICVVAALVWMLFRRNRLVAVVLFCLAVLAMIVLAPGNYINRVLSIVDHSRDAAGSAQQRQAVLMRSLLISARHPLLGVGMGNFPIYSIRNLVTHNSYTQVSAELGIPALIAYLMFMLTPLRRLARIARETFNARRDTRVYYLSVGLFASLIGYMVSSAFIAVAYWPFVYYLVGYAVCLHRIYEANQAALESASVNANDTQQLEDATADHALTDHLPAATGRIEPLRG